MSGLGPQVSTELPGPKARTIIAADELFASPSYIKEYPLVVDRGEGMWIYDVDGNRFLDMMAGIAVNSTGYGHPQVMAAVRAATEKVWHMCATDFYSDAFSRLIARLGQVVPAMGKKRVFVTNSGTEAVEGAIKLARFHTKRSMLLAFHGAFHGRTTGAMSLSASKVHHRTHFGPYLPGVVHLPYPDPLRRPPGQSEDEHGAALIQAIENETFKRYVDPRDVAAIFVEPIQGEGGYVVPPRSFLAGLRRLADRYGILLVFDEIQSGVGRTGSMYAADYFGVAPDVLLTAKGLGSGMPIGAIVAKESVMTWPRASHGSTFGGNSVCCAAALATLDVVEGLLHQIREVGAHLTRGLSHLKEQFPIIADVRGPGLMVGVEFLDPKTKAPLADFANDLVQRAFKQGVLLLGCGTSAIRLTPPLICTTAEVDVCLEILAGLLKKG